MEYWDILDENRLLTGKTVLRGDKLKFNEFHLVVDVWIINNEGKYLLTKRTPNKSFPNLWTVPGGSAITGDSSLQAALREVEEEIGIKLNPSSGKLLFSLKRVIQDNSSFKDVWLFQEDFDIEKVINQADEVSESLWASKDEIISSLRNGEFVPVLDYFIKYF